MKKRIALLIAVLTIVFAMVPGTGAAGMDRYSGSSPAHASQKSRRLSDLILQESQYILTRPIYLPDATGPVGDIGVLMPEEVLPHGIKDMATPAYVKLVLNGINDTRKIHGNKAVPERDDLTAMAKAHALEMAKNKKMYHSTNGLYEAVRVGDYELLQHGGGVGAAAAIHVPSIALRATMKAVGIGAYRRDNIVYICIVADDEDYKPNK